MNVLAAKFLTADFRPHLTPDAQDGETAVRTMRSRRGQIHSGYIQFSLRHEGG